MAKGLTQLELASASHMSINTLSRLENQELDEWPKKTIRTLVRIARLLDVAPLELYDEELRS
jgi:transcriptional regulator with XRE-family HTH domain